MKYFIYSHKLFFHDNSNYLFYYVLLDILQLIILSILLESNLYY